MFKNYIKIAWRSIKNNKTYSGITIAGLTIGLASFLLIATVVINELNYDRHWSKSDRIYRLISENTALGEKRIATPSPLANQLAQNFNQVENFSDISSRSISFEIDKNPVELQTLQVNPNIWEILDFKVLQGNPRKFVDSYPNLVISEKIANNYFPNTNPVGSIVQDITNFGEPTAYYISGVIEDLPVNTHLRANALIIKKPGVTEFSSGNMMPYSNQYLLLKPDVAVTAFTTAANSWYQNLPGAQQNMAFSLQAMEDIYLKSDRFYQDIKGNQNNIQILGGVAILLLVIACINFINLSTAKTLKKIRDTGLRKVLGASRKSLIFQFLTESFLFFWISYLLGLGLYYILLPYLENFLGHQLSLTITGSLQLFSISLLIISMISLFTGIYPAWLISKPNVTRLVSNSYKMEQKSGWFRKSLIITQFTITTGIIVAAIVVNNQLNYLNEKDLGFNQDRLLKINYTNWENNGIAFEEEIKKISGVAQASIGQWIPSSVGGTFSKEIEDPQSQGSKINTWYIDADQNFFSTLDLQLVKGRKFRDSFSAENIMSLDTSAGEEEKSGSQPVLITEYTAQRLNISELNRPYDHIMGIPIGIVKNFHNSSLREPLAPTIIRAIKHPKAGNMLIKLNTENSEQVIKNIAAQYHSFFPEYLFDYSWVADDLEKEFEAENNLRMVLQTFSLLIIFLSCLGLFSLITFIIQNKTKEISIRKVLGASVLQILKTFSTDSLRLILISGLIAIPVSWYLLEKWLADFSYRISLGPMVFIKSVLAVLILAMLTISIKIIKAAFKNPSDNLRTE